MGAETGIFEAIRGNDWGRVKELLVKDPSLAGARDENGVSALMQARYRFRMEMVEALAAAKPELDILEAAALGRKDRVIELLEQDPEWANAWSPDGFPVVGFPAFFGQPEMVKLLLERGADANARARNGSKLHPLNSAAASKNVSAVEALLEHGAEVDAAQAGGYTALHSAANNGDVETAKLLLAKGADRTRTTDDGQTPLMIAEAKGQREIAKLLKEEGEKGLRG